MQHRGVRSIFSFLIILQLLSMLVIPNPGLAAAPASGLASEFHAPEPQNLAGSVPIVLAQTQADTTLSVNIVSTPWASLDNKPAEGPRVFVVEAEVVNEGDAPAENLTVDLNYGDPATGWILLPGEDPDRTIDFLPVDGVYHAYWFASYPTTIGAGHVYTVTASADNAPDVWTSDNYFGNPSPGMTVQTRDVLNTGNSGLTNFTADVVVGVAFTVTVSYELGSYPANVAFSPVGNFDFDPGSYRLLSSSTRFYNSSGTVLTVFDRLYFPTIPSAATDAEVKFTFIALAAQDVSLCPFAAVGYGTTTKYDQFYCDPGRFTVIQIGGELSYDLTKSADQSSVQQGEVLSYSLHYTNTGTLPLSYTWFWDDIDTSIASIVPGSINPPPDLLETTQDRVAWYLGPITAAGQPGSSGVLTFSVLIDGAGQDLPDGASLVNYAYSGIDPGSLPDTKALTATLTTSIQAPDITISKTDGKATAQPGEALPYVIDIQNQGAVLANSLVITDVVPADVIFLGATPPPDHLIGQTFVWDTLGPLAPGGNLQINVQGRVAPMAPEGEVLTNTVTVQYQNPAGHVFAVKTATDTTTVTAPVLSISKTASPDPVLAGRNLTYLLSYANDGPAPATNVVITDTIPADTTYMSCSGGTTCGAVGEDVTWVLGEVPARSNGSVEFVVQVDEDLLTGTYIYNSDYGLRSDQSNFIAGTPVSTLVQREAAVIQGTAFVDTNGNGLFDAGEELITGVDITLPVANPPTTQPTDGNGHYLFRVETQGPATVSSALPAGYERTTAASVQITTTLGITQTVDFGYLPVENPPFGVVYGTVFVDANHNGVQELGESGLEGVTISSTGAQTPTLTTNAYGEFTFRFDTSGTYTVTETNPVGYLSVTPDSVVEDIDAATFSSAEVNFADFHGILVRGQVFEDTNANGVKDSGEAGLPGAGIQAGAESQLTDSNGEYELYAPAGMQPVDIQETDPVGYVSTAAVPGVGMVVVDVNTLRIANPIAGTIYEEADFGDVQPADVVTISGWVWDDNGAGGGGLANGLQDGTEPGLEDATISLSSGLSQLTGSDGSFLLYAPAGQPVTITETNPPGYVSTNAIPGDSATKVDNDTLTVGPLSSGSTSAENTFGDVLAGSVAVITGQVFNDMNEDGVLSPGEDGLPGITVTLEISGGVTIAVQTDSDGAYQFAVVPGTYVRLSSAGPGGDYYPTTPESLVVRPPTAGQFPDNNFGYSNDESSAVIYGIVFDDLDADGSQDLGELGISGAEITLDGMTPPYVTTSNGLISGTFTFIVTEPGVHSVVEKNFYGYRSTTPDQVVVDVQALGRSYKVDFGDTNNPEVAAIYGTVFDDLDSDGSQDADELGLSGVVITATVGTEVITTTTKSYGKYTYGFELVEAGYYTISEQDPALPGYHSTTPDSVNLFVELGNSYIVNFGDTQNGPAVIMGTVFDDLSGDGIQQLGESGLDGVRVDLSTGQTATTGPYGTYRFTVLEEGTVSVEETDPAGYHSTTPNIVVVEVESIPSSHTVNFGDNNFTDQASIFGTVFSDVNVNGVHDPDEPGLPGVTVSLENGDVTSQLTNEWGQYTFWVEATGEYTVTETNSPGWVSTAAIPGSAQVTTVDHDTLLASVDTLGVDLGDNDFGDAEINEVVQISGWVWDDNGAGGGGLADGIKDSEEPYLAGATISVNTGLTTISASDGSFLLYAPAGQELIIHETNPSSDYVSTNAIPGNGAVKVDNDTIKIASPTAGFESTGNLFGDALQANVSVLKTASASEVIAGDVLTYTITVSNLGPAIASGVIVIDTLPAGVTIGTVTPPAGTTFDPGTGTWDVGILEAGPITLNIPVTVHPDVTGSIVNQVNITLNEWDPDPTHNSGSVTTTVTAEADLSLTKSDSPDPVDPNGVLTYTLTYHNIGPSDASGVIITDTLPAEVAFGEVVSQPAGVTGPEIQGQTLLWTAASLPAGESGTIIYTVNVHPDALGSITNMATIASPVTDPDLTNNTDQVSTSVGLPGLAYIYGIVFDDVNGSGIKDAGEVGIPGVTVSLDQEMTTTTAADGSYVFSTGTPGVHVLVETDLAGYLSTTPNEVHLDVELGHNYYVDFGDALKTQPFSSISGTVFEDTDQNGALDAGETGIPGVTVGLDGSVSVQTDMYGRYSFPVIAAGSHTVTETDLPGYTSTTPNQLNFQVVLGQGYTGNFGDAPACTCPGDAYEEDDLAGEAKTIGFGVENAQDRNFCDDSVDWLTFTAQARAVYTITTSAWGQRADTLLAIYDTDGETVLVANDDASGSPDYSSQLVWEAPTGGNYFIKVTNRAGLTCCQTDYRIWIESYKQPRLFLPYIVVPQPTVPTSLKAPVAPNGVVNHICPDDFEMDDTWEQAGPILPGVTQAHSFDSNPNTNIADKDWVWFDARRGDRVVFHLESTPSIQAVMELWDSQGNSLGLLDPDHLEWVAPENGRYYLSVSPLSDQVPFGCLAVAGYNLTMDLTPGIRLYLPLMYKPIE